MSEADDPYERKVQRTGGSTFTVSIPKEWASAQSIDAGSRMHLYVRDDRLLVTPPDATEARRRVPIDGDGRDPLELARIVAAAYVAGAEAIEIRGPLDRDQQRAVREAIAGLVGIEIHEETEDALIARTMLEVGDLSPEQTVLQMEGIACSMHEAAIDAAVRGQTEVGRRLAREDDSVDRLFGLVCREFQRSLVDVRVARTTDDLTTFDFYTAARQLERVADHAEKIGATAARIEADVPEDFADRFRDVGEESRSIVRRAIRETFDGRDTDRLGAIVTDADGVVAEVESLDRELYERSLPDGYLLGTVLDSIARTAEYGVNVAEAGLQASLRQPALERDGDRR